MSRWKHWLILIWASLWFGLILPAHPRGVVRLPGVPSAMCAECPPVSTGHDPEPPASENKKDPVGCCAICHWIGQIDLVIPVIHSPPPLGLLHRLEPVCDSQIAREALACYGERAPPVA